MSPEDAYSILEAIAEIHGCKDKLSYGTMSDAQRQAEETAQEIEEEHKERLSPFTFSKCHIQPGEYVTWSDDPEMEFKVLDEKTVDYKGKPFTLSGLAALLLGKSSSAGVAGPRFFKYKGETLYYYPIKPFNIFAARFVPYFVVVLAGRQARLRPPPRLAQPCLANLFKAFYRIIVLNDLRHRLEG